MVVLPHSSQAQRMARLEDPSQSSEPSGGYSPGSKLSGQGPGAGEESPTVAARVGMGLSSPRRVQWDTLSPDLTVVGFEH